MRPAVLVRSVLSRIAPRTLLFVAISALSIALTTPAIDHIDGLMRVRVADAMLDGRLTAVADPNWSNFFAQGADGETYTIYGLGQPLLLLPLVAVASAFGTIGGEGAGALFAEAFVAVGYSLLVNLVLAAASMGVLRGLRLSPRAAAAGTLVLFVATPWLIWGRSMQEEALVAALLLGALLGILRWKRCGCPWWLASAGLMAGFTASVRPNAVFAVAALVSWLVWTQSPARLKSGVLFIAGSLPALGLFFWWNAYRFGNPLRTGWQAGDAAWSFDFTRLSELLLLPDFGLLWFAPMLPLILLTCQRLRGLGPLMAVAYVAHAVLLAGMPQYVGHAVGVAWGPRYLMHGVLLAGPLVWFGWLKLRKHPLRKAAAALLVLSLAVQWAGLWFQPRLEYAQDVYRKERGLDEISPHAWLPRRFVNIGAWLDGSLEERSFPQDSQVGAGILTTPDLPPLRVTASSRLRGGGALVTVAWTGFVLCLSLAAVAGWFLLRRGRGSCAGENPAAG